MTRLEIGNYVISCDVEMTRALYDQVEVAGPETCGCEFCQNWVIARKHLADPDFVRLLESLGIRYGAEGEVWEAPGNDGRYLYGGWYPFVGSAGDSVLPSGARMTLGPYEISFSTLEYPLPEQFPPGDYMYLCFMAETGRP